MPWTVRAVAALITAQLAASGAVLAARPGDSHPAALLRAAPPPTSSTTVAETTTAALDAPTQPAPPTTTSRPQAPSPVPADAAGRLAARLDGALGSVRSCL